MTKFSPRDLGFPAKFKAWRPHQWEAIQEAVEVPVRFSIHQQPTGSGKSATYIAFYRIIRARAAANPHENKTPRMLVLTATKPLQDQLVRDFKSLNLEDIRGKANFRCDALNFGGELRYLALSQSKRYTADGAPCEAKVRCSLKSDGCDYYDAIRRAKGADIVVTNYAFWLSQQIPDIIGEFDILILDEAHDAPHILSEYMTQAIHEEEVKQFTTWPDGETALEVAEWGSRNRGDVAAVIPDDDTDDPTGFIPTDPEDVTEVIQAKRLLRKIDVIRKADTDPDREWFIERDTHRDEERIRVQPRYPNQFGEEYLFKWVDRVLLFSANVTRRTATNLGIPAEDCRFFETPHGFPVEHRRIYHLPVAKMHYRMTDDERRQVFVRTDQIAMRWPEEKGLVHTVSYSRAVSYASMSRYPKRILLDSPGKTADNLRMFKLSKEPLIFVSPAIMTGYDFPDDLARWQVILKVPFLDTSDPLTKARCKTDPQHTCDVALQKIVQAAGRIVRSEEDWGVTYVLDKNLQWLIWKYKDWVPLWFREAFQSTSSIPERQEVEHYASKS